MCTKIVFRDTVNLARFLIQIKCLFGRFGACMKNRSTLVRKPSQCQRVYEVLRNAFPAEVPLPTLLSMSPRIALMNTRIFELRHEHGLEIRNRLVNRPDGEVESYYVLVADNDSTAKLFGFDGPVAPASSTALQSHGFRPVPESTATNPSHPFPPTSTAQQPALFDMPMTGTSYQYPD